ncbi:MAG: ABC transporter permease, partial [Candidatus Hodarchaeales archaeon]
MGLFTSLKTAKRALIRRKTKNLSAILAISLGVTLMVGIQITTDTLESSYLTSLLLGEGEVDITVTNTSGNYLSAADEENITAMIPDALGIMPVLKTRGPVMVGSQFEPEAEMAGIQLDFPEEFGTFYDWKTGEEMNITSYLTGNKSILLSSHLAKDLDLDKDTDFPVILNTEFYSITVTFTINMTSGLPIITRNQTTIRTELSIEGVYDSNRPGIGSRYRGLIFSLEGLQDWISLQDSGKETDIVSSYLITLKTDHFQTEIDEDYLQEQLDSLVEIIPERTEDGKTFKVYTASSARLDYFTIIRAVFNMMKTMLTTLGLLIIITGILLITNVQLMSIEDREFQTGVMRAVGENRRGIFQAMLIETLFQGIMGGIFGLIGGLLFGQAVAMYLASLFGTGRLSVQPVINQEVMVLSVIIGVLIGIVTGLLPALRASRVNIVNALRGIKVAYEEKSSRNFA